MPLSIKNPEIEALVRELAVRMGESEEQAVAQSLKERLQKVSAGQQSKQEGANGFRGDRLIERLTEIALHCASLPDLDSRSADQILGYDENGLPT